MSERKLAFYQESRVVAVEKMCTTGGSLCIMHASADLTEVGHQANTPYITEHKSNF